MSDFPIAELAAERVTARGIQHPSADDARFSNVLDTIVIGAQGRRLAGN